MYFFVKICKTVYVLYTKDIIVLNQKKEKLELRNISIRGSDKIGVCMGEKKKQADLQTKYNFWTNSFDEKLYLMVFYINFFFFIL